MNHSVVIWAETNEVFWGIVSFIGVNVMDVYDFVESAYDAVFCYFSVGLEINFVSFSLVVCFIFVKMKNIIITTGTETLGVNGYFSFTSLTYLDFWLPF